MKPLYYFRLKLIIKRVHLDSCIKVMMQDSDNFIAEQLLLQCAGVLSDSLKQEIAIKYVLKNGSPICPINLNG
jgi:D-alanyl-D-alanine carboxypeptidase/D-alanyl-D-alanine-endopeptidase (penicillin-binding protein 4)